MPNGNGRGPEGRGSMTGRKLGYCNGYNHAGYEVNGYNHSGRRGSFGGRGMGRGFRNRWAVETDYANDQNYDRMAEIISRLDNMSRRLENLEINKEAQGENSDNI